MNQQMRELWETIEGINLHALNCKTEPIPDHALKHELSSLWHDLKELSSYLDGEDAQPKIALVGIMNNHADTMRGLGVL